MPGMFSNLMQKSLTIIDLTLPSPCCYFNGQMPLTIARFCRHQLCVANQNVPNKNLTK